MRRWRNWQTHHLEVVAPSRVWRFKSSPAHTRKPSKARFSFCAQASRTAARPATKSFISARPRFSFNYLV